MLFDLDETVMFDPTAVQVGPLRWATAGSGGHRTAWHGIAWHGVPALCLLAVGAHALRLLGLIAFTCLCTVFSPSLWKLHGSIAAAPWGPAGADEGVQPHRGGVPSAQCQGKSCSAMHPLSSRPDSLAFAASAALGPQKKRVFAPRTCISPQPRPPIRFPDSKRTRPCQPLSCRSTLTPF